jgi:hypothetical protein
MHAPGVPRSSPNRAVIRRPWCLQSLLIWWGGTAKSRNEIDNLDNLETLINPLICLELGWLPSSLIRAMHLSSTHMCGPAMPPGRVYLPVCGFLFYFD